MRGPGRAALLAMLLAAQLFAPMAALPAAAQDGSTRERTGDVAGRLSTWFGIVNNTDTSFDDAVYFLDHFGDWPARTTLQRRAEQLMPADLPNAAVLGYFQKYPAVSSRGVQRHVSALLAAGKKADAASVVRGFWREADLEPADETAFLQANGKLLTAADHNARLDFLIWEGRAADARRQLLRVDDGHKALGQARLALAANDGGAETLLAKVPGNLRADSGLTYERVRWRRRHDLTQDAIALLAQQPANSEHADDWWTERNILARRLLLTGEVDRAQTLVAAHEAPSGDSRFEAEFLAGWISLRYQRNPVDALKHFTALEKIVSSPISRARAKYWQARAETAAGRTKEASAHLREAAQYTATYYGQLAAAQLDKNAAVDLTAKGPDAGERKSFQQLDLVRVALSMPSLGPQYDKTSLFFARMGQVLDRGNYFRLAAEMASGAGRLQLAVKLGKAAASRGMGVVPEAYPLLGFATPSQPEAALVHGIVRQESEFNAGSQSPVGARGLMQLMPKTAQLVANRLGVATSDTALLGPQHNVKLGAAYLQDLIDRFGGSYVLAIAAYNAGPTRVVGWIQDYGDPRTGQIDTVDWIESIPFTETRNYVMRVLEATQVYRARLNKGKARIGLVQDLYRGGPAQR